MTVPVQPDLFGEYDADQQRLEAVRRRRQADRDRYERREFLAPYDSAAGGTRAGDTVLGWVCPACGQVEWTEFALQLNHGYDPGRYEGYPAQWTEDPWGSWCFRKWPSTEKPVVSEVGN